MSSLRSGALSLWCVLVLCCVPVAAEEIRMGAILDLSGPYAPQGRVFLRGIELASEEQGKGVRLFVEDSGYSPRKAASAATSLISQQLVSVIFSMTASETKTVAPVARRANVLSVSVWDSSPEIEALGPLSFGFGPWSPATGEWSADFAYTDLSSETAAIVCQHEEWSQMVCKHFTDRYKLLGGRIVLGQSLDPETVDFRTSIARMKFAKPELVFFPLAKNAPEFLRQAHAAGLKAKFLSADVITDEDISRLGGALEGVYQIESRVGMNDRLAEVLARYRDKYGEDCDLHQFLAWGYDAAKIILAAWKRSDHQTGNALAAEVKKTALLPGASGVLTVNERGSLPRYPGAFVVRDGKFRRVAISGH